MPAYIEGFVETKRALSKFAPDLYKEMNREIRHSMQDIINAAKAKLPSEFPYELRNFNEPKSSRKSATSKERAFPSYNQSIVRKGLTYSFTSKRPTSGGFKAMYTLLNKSAAGAIMETAGTINPHGRNSISQRKWGQSSKNMSLSKNPNAGDHFISVMNSEIGSIKHAGNNNRYAGRLLVAAYEENQGRSVARIMRAINIATSIFNNRVESGRIAA